MDGNMLKLITELIFGKYLLWLAPVLLVFCTTLFADRIIELVQEAIFDNKRRLR